MTDGWGISCKIALRWMPLDLTDDKSTLVQVMTWCHQATSHYLSLCWPRIMSPYGVTRPQWVNVMSADGLAMQMAWTSAAMILTLFNQKYPGPVQPGWTYLPLDRMTSMLFSDSFSWMKSFSFWLEFHWSLFLRVQLTTTQHLFRKWLGAK